MPSPSVIKIKTRTPRATNLKAKQIAEAWGAKLRAQSVFSARTTELAYVNELKRRLKAVAGGKETPQVAIRKLRATLAKLGYTPDKGFPNKPGLAVGARGSIADLSSEGRLRLIMNTLIQQARSMGQIESSKDPTMLFLSPAWRLVRTGWRRVPRLDWKKRWSDAGDSVNWEGAVKGEFVALKNSPIWAALGNGEGGFTDTLHEAHPPFAYGSGMGWVHCDRKEAIALGLDVSGTNFKSAKPKVSPKPKRKPKPVKPKPEPQEQEKESIKPNNPVDKFSFDLTTLKTVSRKINMMRETVNNVRRSVDAVKGRLASAMDAIHEAHGKVDVVADIAEGKLADIEATLKNVNTVVNTLVTQLSQIPLPINTKEQADYNAKCAELGNVADMYVKKLEALNIDGVPHELEAAAKIAMVEFEKRKRKLSMSKFQRIKLDNI